MPALRRRLKAWFAQAKRDLPWRGSKDPYRIWISEVMLQQTRVAAVVPYYTRFLERFPDVHALARAPEEAVLDCWSGLGYYSRARNLHKAAQWVARNGAFPRDYEALQALPGVGEYTAAAIASIAFDLPHAVLDGNVLRVLCRLAEETGDTGAGRTKARLRELAGRLLDREDPGGFNQAMMELGATVCVPEAPQCLLCPVQEFCRAKRSGSQGELPVKPRRQDRIRVKKVLLWVQRDGHLLLWQRGPGRLAGFWELPEAEQLPAALSENAIGAFRHSITRYDYLFTLVEASVTEIPSGFHWVDKSRLGSLPLSTTTKKSLKLFDSVNKL